MNATVPAVTRYRIPAATRAAVARALRTGLGMLRADPPQRLADWARENFRLSGDSSHQKGGWEAWPFQVGILDAFSNDDIEQVDVMKAKRVGYTKMVTAFIGYNAAHRHRKQALWQPTDDDRDSYVKSEVEPMIAEVPAVRAARRSSRTADDTMKYKQFKASVAHFLGGKAARAYRRITVAVAIMDEIDGFDQQIEKSANPVTLARGRLEGAPFPKLICGSTPLYKGLSHVERQAMAADEQMRFHITCPHCEVEHPLIWGGKNSPHGLKWEKSKPETARHICPHCRKSISQADYLQLWKTGVYVGSKLGLRYGLDRQWRDAEGLPTRPPRHIAFMDVWTAYSPQRTWEDIARECIESARAAKSGDNSLMKGFTNETLARTWEEDYEKTEVDILKRRAQEGQLPLGVVPRWASILTQYFDVQGDRWEYVITAHGREGETAHIEYGVIHGNTADITEWETKIAPRLGISYPHANSGRLAVSATGIDTGFQTHVAYEFCRRHKPRGVHATKGDNQLGKPIKARRAMMDINYKGRVIRKGVALWHIGTDTAKDLLHGRLQLQAQGPGRIHYAANLPDAFFEQLTAEQRIPIRSVRGLEYRWECPTGKRNEVLDCVVGNMFLAELLDLPKWTDRQWQRAESALQPDLFDQAPQPQPQPDPQQDTHPQEQAKEQATHQEATPAPQAQPPGQAPARRPPPRAAITASDEWNSRL